MGIEDYSPMSGRLIDEDGNVVNIVDLLGGDAPVSTAVYDIEQYAPRSGRVIGEDGFLYNLVDLLLNAGGGSGGGAVIITPSTVVSGITNGKTLTVAAGKVAGMEIAYTHTQSIASATWNIQHNLNSQSVTVLTVDTGGDEVIGQRDTQASTVNLLVLRFSEPIVGIAYIKY